MFSQATLASIVATAALLAPGCSALGINCRGSGLCPRAGWDNQASTSVMQGLRDAMYGSKVPDSTTYKSGDHIVCVSQSQKITITPGVSASAGGKGGSSAGGSISAGLSGSIGNGGICVFAQKLPDSSNTITLGDAKKLMDGLLQHGCTTCGSNPTVQDGSNDTGKGELTVNYVANPFCVGSCLSDSATAADSPTNPSAPTGDGDGDNKKGDGKKGKNDKKDKKDKKEKKDAGKSNNNNNNNQKRWGKDGERLRAD